MKKCGIIQVYYFRQKQMLQRKTGDKIQSPCSMKNHQSRMKTEDEHLAHLGKDQNNQKHKTTKFKESISSRNPSQEFHYRSTFRFQKYTPLTPKKQHRKQQNGSQKRVKNNLDENQTRKTAKYITDGLAGKGTFGTVYFGRDNQGNLVAIKKVFIDRKFKNRELKILNELKNPCVLKILDHFTTHENQNEFLFIVTQFFPGNLQHVRIDKQLTPLKTKLIMFQLLKGLHYLRTLSIAHRDIKPQNILVDTKNYRTVIADFGSAKRLIQGEKSLAYICSRSYRAPELNLGAVNYDTQIDMWALGCVFVELINGQTPFFSSSSNQLLSIIKAIGTPTEEQIIDMNENYPIEQYKDLPEVKGKPWNKLLSSQQPEIISLVEGMLQYSPKKRLTPAEALAHEYFDELRCKQVYRKLKSTYPSLPNIFYFSKDEKQNILNLEHIIPSWYEPSFNS